VRIFERQPQVGGKLNQLKMQGFSFDTILSRLRAVFAALSPATLDDWAGFEGFLMVYVIIKGI
jgi:phytoene dehydrogenase-like protein